MCRKLVLLISAVLALGLVNNAFATDYTWTNTTGNANWCDADNWDPDSGPPEGSAAMAFIDERSPNRGPIVPISCNVDSGITGPEPNWGHVQVIDINTSGTVNIRGDWMWTMEEAPGGAGTGVININGSPTVTIGGLWRGGDYGVGIVNIDGDPNISVDNDFRGADGGTGSFYINMSGGRLECQDDLLWGDNGGGELNLSGGSLIVGDNLDLGGYRGAAPITINMTDGSISVGGKLLAPGSANRAGVVRINLYGGVIDCDEFVHGGSDGGEDEPPDDPTFTDDWRLDIEQGTLIIDGNVVPQIDANVAAGQITAYDGDGTVNVELVDGNTVVTASPPDPNLALNPYPPHGSTMVDPNVVLSWTPGASATEHLVFFGTTFQDVNTMTDPCATRPLGNETYYPGPLELLTTYYWRVDANNGGLWRGKVWHFTTKSPIDDPNLLVHLKLDEPNGVIAHDSSGHGNHGAVDGNELGWDPCDGHPHDGGCRNFTGLDDEADTVIDIQSTTLLNTIDDSITVTVWLKNAYNTDDDDNWVFHTGVGGEQGPYQVGACVVTEDIEPVGQALWRAGSDTNDILTWDLGGRDPETLQGWHFWAFVKDESVDEMRIYFDGILEKERGGCHDTLANIYDVAFKIGAASWENYSYMGKQDDFRLYDYALLDENIEELYRGADVGRAWGPEPGDFEVDVPRDANLVWKPGSYAVSHDVYLGTDFVDVSEANNSWPEDISVYKGNQELCEYNTPGLLEFETTYYWRIDEVNGPCTWPGPVWRFKTVNYFVVDDFESYNKTTNQIKDTWREYWWQALNPPYEPTGAVLDLGVDPHDTVHTGSQSVKYQYKNKLWPEGYATVCYSEAWLPIPTEEQDWTREGVKLLRLYFYGDADNDTNDSTPMYVGVKDGDGNYAEVRYGEYNSEDEDMNDFKVEEWQKWDVVLSHFSDSNFASVVNDVNLANIAELYMGFGDKQNPVCGGEGIVIFDDIRLYLPICNPKYGPAADFSGDCVVNLADVGIMGEHWLLTDANFGSAIEKPNDANLAGWWKMDDGSGNTATDDSGYGNDGTIEGCYMWVTGHNDVNTALKFRLTGGRVLVPDDGNTPELRPQQVSVCAWVYYPESQDQSARVVVKGADNKETFDLEVHDDDEFVFLVRDANELEDDGDYKKYDVNGPVWPGSWIHLAGTYDGSSVKCYVNGQLTDSKDANDPNFLLSQDPCGLGIGNRSDANDKEFIGTIDDVRVYDYALSAAEVAWLASDGTGYVGLAVPFNLYDEESVDLKVINFKDFAVLMESWLERKRWPE
ncbi:MAG: LamG domain-containing protein [Planctomycetota bacterium]